ncbi:MAG TPA: hypothetical protein VGN88_09850 [Phycisphaerae bacterium]
MTQAVSDPAQISERRKWKAALTQLIDDIAQWSEAHNWTAERHVVELNEDGLGAYKAPMIRIRKGRRTLTIQPLARFISGGDGRVDIEGRIAYKKLLLIRKKGDWKIFTNDRIPWPESWGEAAFIKLAEALTAP